MRSVRIKVCLAALLVAGLWSLGAAEGLRGNPYGRELDALRRAYPQAGIAVVEDAGGFFISLGGERIFLGPKAGCPEPPHPDHPEDAPLCASFVQPYPAGAGHRHPAAGFEPGRVRNEALLKSLYGGTAREVEAGLREVDFFGEKLRFSDRHGAGAALDRVKAKLAALVREKPDVAAYILPTGGTYAWRKISKSPRLSAHSFGVCIDLNIEKGIYWQWKPSPKVEKDAREKYPQEIVDIFEAEGFIWGGKWYSFDFMHFEYRPELLLYAKE
ncbi:M15 family metallopeptidase [Desulfovibrio sp. OttesenSCG-928-O18]|nr:M15 family metallopeptidase [Desulfovibrio sp. OttesenSCG-928-O18]